jgi:hypothetical protein
MMETLGSSAPQVYALDTSIINPTSGSPDWLLGVALEPPGPCFRQAVGGSMVRMPPPQPAPCHISRPHLATSGNPGHDCLPARAEKEDVAAVKQDAEGIKCRANGLPAASTVESLRVALPCGCGWLQLAHWDAFLGAGSVQALVARAMGSHQQRVGLVSMHRKDVEWVVTNVMTPEGDGNRVSVAGRNLRRDQPRSLPGQKTNWGAKTTGTQNGEMDLALQPSTTLDRKPTSTGMVHALPCPGRLSSLESVFDMEEGQLAKSPQMQGNFPHMVHPEPQKEHGPRRLGGLRPPALGGTWPAIKQPKPRCVSLSLPTDPRFSAQHYPEPLHAASVRLRPPACARWRN